MIDASPVLVTDDGTGSNKRGNPIQIACHNSILYLFIPSSNFSHPFAPPVKHRFEKLTTGSSGRILLFRG
jgi:hypothetical protein